MLTELIIQCICDYTSTREISLKKHKLTNELFRLLFTKNTYLYNEMLTSKSRQQSKNNNKINFNHLHFTNLDLSNLHLHKVEFKRSTFYRSVQLEGTILEDVTFHKSELNSCAFSFNGVVFSGKGFNFSGVQVLGKSNLFFKDKISIKTNETAYNMKLFKMRKYIPIDLKSMF